MMALLIAIFDIVVYKRKVVHQLDRHRGRYDAPHIVQPSRFIRSRAQRVSLRHGKVTGQ
jgi:hypothetical protein